MIEEQTKSDSAAVKIYAQYLRSNYIRGDNTLEKAVAKGALDARKLYPDVPAVTLEEAAKEFYANPPTLEYDVKGWQI